MKQVVVTVVAAVVVAVEAIAIKKNVVALKFGNGYLNGI